MQNIGAMAVVFIFAAGILSGCASNPVDKAFAGNMKPDEETKTIVEYCQSCHIHRDFEQYGHLAKVKDQYKKEPYNTAGDCKTCHKLTRNFWNDAMVHTHFPEGRLVNE